VAKKKIKKGKKGKKGKKKVERELASIQRAAATFGKSPQTITNWINDGKIKTFPVPDDHVDVKAGRKTTRMVCLRQIGKKMKLERIDDPVAKLGMVIEDMDDLMMQARSLMSAIEGSGG